LSNEYILDVVPALLAIACPKTAAITTDAIASLQLGPAPSAAQAKAAVVVGDAKIKEALAACDERYFENDEPIAGRLFEWIKANRHRITVSAS
jgi:hypothetical protein